jgi:alpha-amylase
MKIAVQTRKAFKVWGLPQVERWVLDDLYAFSRGQVFIATTNQVDNTVSVGVTYHPYKAGQVICNVLYSGDCLTIAADNTLNLTLLHGESKIYVP